MATRKSSCTRILRRIVREATKSPRITVKELQALLASWGQQVSKTTIRRHLHNHSLIARRKPFLTTKHRRKQLEFAKRHLHYHWNKVLWSDQTKIECFCLVKHWHVWCRNRDAYKEKHGMVVVQSCFTSRYTQMNNKKQIQHSAMAISVTRPQSNHYVLIMACILILLKCICLKHNDYSIKFLLSLCSQNLSSMIWNISAQTILYVHKKL